MQDIEGSIQLIFFSTTNIYQGHQRAIYVWIRYYIIFLIVQFATNIFDFDAQIYFRTCRRLMRRKSDFTITLDEMFCQDDKKRVNAIKQLREIAATMGPARVRNELVPFLNQFLEDDPSIMLALLDQLQNFSSLLGGAEHDKILLPLLINFCLLDQKQVALRSLALVQQILSKFTDLYLDTIKKLLKVDMCVSKECAIILVTNGVKKVPHLESTFLDIYKNIVFSQNPSLRIIAARYFRKIVQNCVNKDQICKIVDIFYNDAQDLPKLLTIESLLLIYSFNPTFVMNKIKMLVCIGTWRINMRLSQYSNQFSKVLSKLHFKTLIQPFYLKMMGSEDNQIRASSCITLVSIAKNMTVQQNSSKLYPVIMKLSEDKVDFVKNQFAKNLVKVFPYFSQQKIKDNLIPLIIKFLKQSNLEVSAGILQDFKQLSKHLKVDKFQESILKPLASQLAAENWRLKIQTLDILGKIVTQQDLYSDFIVDILIKQMKNKIQAVRIKATSVVISVIKKSPKEWSEPNLLPLVIKMKDQSNYLLRQRVLSVIQETADVVSSVWISNYKKIIGQMLVDKIPNVRMMTLKCIIANKKLVDKGSEGLIIKMREDTDMQIKQAAKEIKI